MRRAGSVVAVVLAGGRGSRFVGSHPKLLTPFRGRGLVEWAVESAVEAAIGPVVVVQGAVDLHDLIPVGVDVVSNPRWSEGQATSLAIAVDAAARTGAESMVVCLGDQPFITPEAWRAVAATEAEIAIAIYDDGRRGHPVKLSQSVWPLLPSKGDGGARVLMAERSELVVEVACPGDPADIDTVEDLTRWS